MFILSEDYHAIVTKLKAEWKTFALAVVTSATGAWQFAVAQGASLPDLFSWVPPEYHSAVLFLVGLLFLALRRYVPVQIPDQTNV